MKVNHSDDLDGDRAPLPCFRPSPANQPLFSPAVTASNLSTTSTQDGETYSTTNKYHQRITNSYAYRLRDHVKMGKQLPSEFFKGKLRLGAIIIKKGGWENLFKEVFRENEGEKLLKASQCYLSTAAGPVVGILFISTQKVAFCSDRSFTLRSPNGDLIQQPYKVWIPTNKIKEANEKVGNPSQKYIQIVTDSSELWFMGFVRYEKAIHNLRMAMSSYSN